MEKTVHKQKVMDKSYEQVKSPVAEIKTYSEGDDDYVPERLVNVLALPNYQLPSSAMLASLQKCRISTLCILLDVLRNAKILLKTFITSWSATFK